MKIIVIGDIILDINHIVNSKRNAPEAINLPIYLVEKTEYILGGAANVAKNLNNLENCEIELISIIGNDYYSNILIKLLNKYNIKNTLFTDITKCTTQKYRLFNDNNLINRYDIENTSLISKDIEDNIYNYIISKNNIDAIIISDYNKGIITDNLCINVINYSNNNNIYTFIDPKINNYLKYKNCFCFKPNFNEGQVISNNNNIYDILFYINKNLNCNNILLTDSDKGMYLFENNIINHINAKYNFKLIDVTGAGDIVLSVLVYIYLKTKDLLLASKISNFIANKSINYIGNYTINQNDFIEYDILTNNIIYENEINKIEYISNNYNNIIFTNGCFDIIHSAHIKLLKFAKSKGDILVLGINTDDSIKINKGIKRPINNLEERIELLKSLELIDFIIVFNEKTPLNIMKILKPKILIKGSDYNIINIIGKEYADEIVFFNYIKDKSTTNIINKIKNNK